MTGWLHAQANPQARRRRIFLIQLLALLPVTLIAMVNFGYQYLAGLQNSAQFDGAGLRGQLADLLVLNVDRPGIYDFFVAGFAHLLPMFLLAFLVAGLWERLNADRQKQPLQFGFVRDALLFTLLLPALTSFTLVAIYITLCLHNVVLRAVQQAILIFQCQCLIGIVCTRVVINTLTRCEPMSSGRVTLL